MIRSTMKTYDISKIRQSFKFLEGQNNIIYLDNASTTQKPEIVLNALSDFYRYSNANVHRGAYRLSEMATDKYEKARKTVANFIGAKDSNQIVFLRGCTEAINLVARSYGSHFKPGDEVIISALEHHANIVPWQILAQEKDIKIRVIELNSDGTLNQAHYQSLLNNKTKLVAISHISNVLGGINEVETMIAQAHQVGAKCLIDAAQSPAHIKVDVEAMDCDFLTFSGHKHYGPTGIGVLYAKSELLSLMPPYQTGGSMITTVGYQSSEYMEAPHKFEAGTPAYAEAYGMAEALDFMNDIGIKQIKDSEDELVAYTLEKFNSLKNITLYGPTDARIGIFSFLIDGAHAHDVATILDADGIAVRAGHHCAMPLMKTLGVPALVRASLGVYNTKEEVDHLFDGLNTVRKIFANE